MARFGSRYGELDEEIGGDANTNVLSSATPNSLSAMDTQDASKHLFGQVDWDEFLRTEVFLSQTEVIFDFFSPLLLHLITLLVS
jgi:hypothetical protein